ncbi:MerR family transcriptional regulator [Spirochaeta dissipatitropha]
MLTISAFSRVSSLSIKALRIYHEEGILIPERIDAETGYRYYGDESTLRAGIIRRLRDMNFSLADIKEIFGTCSDDEELIEQLKAKQQEIRNQARKYMALDASIQSILSANSMYREESAMSEAIEVQKKEIAEKTICSIRFKGAYNEIGTHFGSLYRQIGRYASGKPFALYHDDDYKESDADIEACVEVRKAVSKEGIDCRVLPGGTAASILHHGPYEELGRSYKKLFDFCNEHGHNKLLPSREIYIRGPGMIFPRNPKRFVTEIQFMIR